MQFRSYRPGRLNRPHTFHHAPKHSLKFFFVAADRPYHCLVFLAHLELIAGEDQYQSSSLNLQLFTLVRYFVGEGIYQLNVILQINQYLFCKWEAYGWLFDAFADIFVYDAADAHGGFYEESECDGGLIDVDCRCILQINHIGTSLNAQSTEQLFLDSTDSRQLPHNFGIHKFSDYFFIVTEDSNSIGLVLLRTYLCQQFIAADTYRTSHLHFLKYLIFYLISHFQPTWIMITLVVYQVLSYV